VDRCQTYVADLFHGVVQRFVVTTAPLADFSRNLLCTSPHSASAALQAFVQSLLAFFPGGVEIRIGSANGFEFDILEFGGAKR